MPSLSRSMARFPSAAERSTDVPSIPALAEAVVCAFGVAPVVDKYQAAIYFMSADERHKAKSLRWQIEHQNEVSQLIALMPALQ
jgi:hypothetical protein